MAKQGRITGFTGVDDVYEPPLFPELCIDTVAADAGNERPTDPGGAGPEGIPGVRRKTDEAEYFAHRGHTSVKS